MHLGRGFFAAPSVLAAFAASSPARQKVSARRCRPRCSIPACQRRCGERRSRKRFLMEFVRDRSAINSVKALQRLQPPSSPLHGPPPQRHGTLLCQGRASLCRVSSFWGPPDPPGDLRGPPNPPGDPEGLREAPIACNTESPPPVLGCCGVAFPWERCAVLGSIPLMGAP